ncbi:MAG: 50S ribosomal protein L21 [Bacteroidales bacterium]|nr:50S ribosomal protein L21 [Bacteroidales bacterium]MCF8402313.1 50S ribosomal protein L21 [Bacteroidales bacterium]
MYAIVEIAGQQFKVEKEQEIFVHRLEGDAGSMVEFDQVKLFDNEGKITVGAPDVDGVVIKAKIVEHMRSDKVIVFHKKRRKGYQKQNGHRQYMSKILIEDILTGVKKTEKKAAVKEEPVKKEAPVKKAETKTAEKKEVKAEKKEAPKAKKAAPKKAAAPKAKKETAPKAKKEAAPKA